jgi:2-dehydropantoate 2-reductase
MRIAVIGAGAMGSLVAGLLQVAQALEPSIEVWLVGAESSKAHLEAIQTNGLHLDLTAGALAQLTTKKDSPTSISASLKTPIFNLHVTQNPELAYPCDLAIILVKSYRTAQAAQQVAQLLAADGLAISLQNGLGNTDILGAVLGVEHSIQGTSLLGANLLGPAHVAVASLHATTIAVDVEMPLPQRHNLELLQKCFELVGVPLHFTDNLQSVLWAKLIINCAVNPVAALLDIPNGALLKSEATRQLMTAVAQEVVLVAHAYGVNLPFPDSHAPTHAMHAAEINSDNFCSMLQDLRRGRPTEIEAINGAVVRIAESLGLTAPINQTLTQLIIARQSLPKYF